MMYRSIALFDVSYSIVRNYKVRASNTNASPFEVAQGALLGTLAEMAATRDSVEHVVLCLDAPPYWRSAIYPEYKGQRPRQDPELTAIKKTLLERIEQDGYSVARVPSFEADDLIATLVQLWHPHCPDIRIISADKDAAQCVRYDEQTCFSVRMFVPAVSGRPEEIRGPTEIFAKFGAHPKDMAFFQALVGDDSDNIPGVYKCGPVTAAKWILQSGGDPLKLGVELAKQSELGPKMTMAWQHLAKCYTQIPLWLNLTTLRTDVPIDADALLVKRKVQPLVEVSDADDSDFIDLEEERKLMADDEQGFIPFGKETNPKHEAIEFETPLKLGKVPTHAAGVATSPFEPIEINDAQRSLCQNDLVYRAPETLTPEQRDLVARWSAERDRLAPAFTHDVHGNKLPKASAPATSSSSSDGATERVPNSPIGPKQPELPSSPPATSETSNSAASVVPPTQGPARPRKVDALEQTAMVIAPPSWALATQPNSAADAFGIAVKLMNSRLYQRFVTVEAIAAVILRGRELGLGMTTALDAFHVIEGRPSCSAQLISALAERDPNHEWTRMLSSSAVEATFQCKDKRFPEPSIPFQYTIEEADAIGLLKPSWRTGEPSQWVKRPRDMLIKTAKSKLHKIMFPGATLGLHAIEEEPEE